MSVVKELLGAKILTIKVGSALLVEPTGIVRQDWLNTLAQDVAQLKARGSSVIIVTSGAIALGRRILGLPKRTLRLEEKQAAAAAGQIMLAGAWRDSLAEHEIKTAQLLITPEDTEGRRRYLNARATVTTLLQLGAVPVVNENDTVATSEIRFGDNDRLSARVAIMAGAETLILLSDIDGLFTADPTQNATAEHLPIVDEITPAIEAMAGISQSDVGTGGMTSKLLAAKLASRAGTTVILSKGTLNNPLAHLENGGRHTVFVAKGNPLGARKQWIGASLDTQGSITVDDGAAQALTKGASLLPAGVVDVQGQFERGDAVMIINRSGKSIAKGLTAYDIKDALMIRGCKTAEVAGILGWQGRDALVHRDDLVVL